MESVDKRTAILAAAGKQFAKSGFHETKMEAIAEEAGVAKGTVYLYFKDKNALLFEVTRYYRQRYLENVRQKMEPYESAQDKLRAYSRIHILHFAEMLNFNKLNFEQLLKGKKTQEMMETMRTDQREMITMLEGLVRYGIERGEFREVDATDAALIIMGSLHAYMHSAAIGSVEQKKGDSQADALVDIVLGGLVRQG